MESLYNWSTSEKTEPVNFKKYSGIFSFFTLLFFTILICCPLVFLISKYYPDVVWFVYGHENKAVSENQSLKLLFNIVKFSSPLILAWVVIIWGDFFNGQKKTSVRFVKRTGDIIAASFYNNKAFFCSLKKETRFTATVFFTILFIGILYFLFAIPLQYDEWASYSVFTGPGFWATLSNYSTTNNHIFSNLVVCVFTKLPFDPEITMRLPYPFVTLLCMWYFFKLCKYCFNDTVSVILLVFVILPYPLVMYAFAARGYMFLNLFCVLMMYASFHLSENYRNKKYRGLFILSMVLGTFSMPTFIYAILPVCIVLAIYVIKQKQQNNLGLLIKDGLVSAGLILLCYSFVLAFNDLDGMMKLNGFSTKFKLSDPGVLEKIVAHLKSVCSYLFYFKGLLPVISTLIVVSTIFYLVKIKSRAVFICALSAAMFFSPILILVIQRVIPFERNWLYLIFPIALCVGFIVHNIINLPLLQPFVGTVARYKLGINALVLAISIFSLSRFTASHANYAFIDFEINILRQKHLNAVIRNIREIGMTKKDDEYHSADMIYYLCLKYDPKRQVMVNELTTVGNQEILIIHKTETERFKEGLNNYKLLMELDGKINVYGRANLF